MMLIKQGRHRGWDWEMYRIEGRCLGPPWKVVTQTESKTLVIIGRGWNPLWVTMCNYDEKLRPEEEIDRLIEEGTLRGDDLGHMDVKWVDGETAQ